MGVIPLYIPDLHDMALFRHHRNGLTDHEIADLMSFSAEEIAKQRTRLKLSINRPPRPKGREGASKPDPLALAQTHIPGFDRNRLTLHGKPIKLRDMGKMLNQILKQDKRDQVGPDSWRV